MISMHVCTVHKAIIVTNYVDALEMQARIEVISS